MRANIRRLGRARRQTNPGHPNIESVDRDIAFPSIESLHRDIAFANGYRIELIKLLLTIAAALFAFTVTFRPTLDRVHWQWAMWIGWAGLALSIGSGMLQMLGWEHYYKSYRDFDHKFRKLLGPISGAVLGKIKRRVINRRRIAGMTAQFVGFAIGVIGVSVFAAANLDAGHQQTPAVTCSCASSAPVVRSCLSASSAPASTTEGK